MDSLKNIFGEDYVKHLTSHLDNSDFYESLEKARYSYSPLYDACIIRSFDTSIEPTQLVDLWNAWFYDSYRSPEKYTENNPVLDLVAEKPELRPAYEVFQHEIRAHRLPIIYSSFGILLASLQFRTNTLFINLLETRSKTREFTRELESNLNELAKYIFNLMDSARVVLESLAVFRDMLIAFQIENKKNKEIEIEKIAFSMLNNLEIATKKDKRYLPYLIGYKMALTLFNKFGFLGVEVAVTYALNPLLSKEDFYKQSFSPFIRYNDITEISDSDIPSSLDIDDPFAIDLFLKDKLEWRGYNESRDHTLKVANDIFPELINSGFPSKDIFLSSDKRGTIIPEFIFIQSGENKNILTRAEGDYLGKLYMNFMVSIIKTKAAIIIKTGKIESSYCPFRFFYGSIELCKTHSDGIACKMLQDFCGQYKLSMEMCS